jgi:hypothetical protein
MSEAVRQEILDELASRLESIDECEEFDLNPSGEPSTFPALYMEEGDQDADDGTEPGATRYTLKGTIEGYVKGGGGREATAARSSLYLAVVRALLGGDPIHHAVEEVHERGMRLATATLSKDKRLAFALDFEILFVGMTGDPVA